MSSGQQPPAGRGHHRQGPPRQRHLHLLAAKHRRVHRVAPAYGRHAPGAHWRGLALAALGIALGVIGGVSLWHLYAKAHPNAPGPDRPAATEPAGDDISDDLVDAQDRPDPLPEGAAYEPKDNTLDIEISEYAGYAGLLIANAGQLAPNDNSIFTRRFGFRVRLTSSESEDWGPIQTGKLAASTTTVDVLGAYGKSLGVVAPVLIGYSAGADAMVVRSDIHNAYDLKGKVLVVPQFTEADFLTRYLVNQVGLAVQPLDSLDPAGFSLDKVNLVFAASVDRAQNILAGALDQGDHRVAGAVVWAPFDSDLVQGYPKDAHVLTTTRDLALVADVLIVNKGFAARHPKLVHGLVAGVLAGNAIARQAPARAQAAICAAFPEWGPDDARRDLGNVRLASLADNRAFFAPDAKRVNTYRGIYHAAQTLYYGDQASDDGGSFLLPGVLEGIKEPTAATTKPR